MDSNSKGYVLWSMLLGFGYVYYMTSGFSLMPKNNPYNKLFDLKTYCIHLLIAGLFSAGGLYLCQHGLPVVGFFMPMAFLLTFLLSDKIAQLLIGRHVIIATRWDKKPSSYKWYVDGFLGFLILFIPLISAGVALNWFRFGM